MHNFNFSPEILHRFPGICVMAGTIEGVVIKEGSPSLEDFKKDVIANIKSMYVLENVKNDPGFRAYRDFFWSVGVDPTKTRPASEALVRRILSGGKLPVINTAVDSYNLASAISGVPIAAFDADRIEGDLNMRFASGGESFKGIGMKEPVTLKPEQVILTDRNKIVAIYPYRDSDDTKVTPSTKNMLIVSCGVPGIDVAKVKEAYQTCVEYLAEYAGGDPVSPAMYP